MLFASMLLLPSPSRTPAPTMNFLDDVQNWLLSVGPDFVGEDELSPLAQAAVNDICRPDGWTIKCEIGSEPARRVGGSGTLAKGSSSTGNIDLKLQFSVDEGYSPPQGPVKLLRSSRFFQDVGFWKVDADTDDGVPQQVQWRLRTSEEGITLGGQELVPKGDCYFNALCTAFDGEPATVTLGNGRITVKEEIGANVGIFNAKGILAEFKIVGVFDAAKARAE